MTEGRRATFDYGAIKDEHRAVAEEISKVCLELGYDELAALIAKKFEVVVRPVFDIRTTKIFEACQKANIYMTTNGLMSDGDMDYPIIGICDDIRKVERLYHIIKRTENDSEEF